MDPDVLIIIDDDDDDDIEINEHFTTHQADDDDWSSLRKVIRTLDLDTELIEIKPDVPSRICTAALSYVNLLDTHIIIVDPIERYLRVRENNLPFAFPRSIIRSRHRPNARRNGSCSSVNRRCTSRCPCARVSTIVPYHCWDSSSNGRVRSPTAIAI